MPEGPSAFTKNPVWKTGAKSLNMVANAASSVAKTAGGGAAGGGSSSRRKGDDGGEAIPMDDSSDAALSSQTGDASARPGKEKKGMLKKTLKTFNKAANKVNPLRSSSKPSGPAGTPSNDDEKASEGGDLEIMSTKTASSSLLNDLGTDEAEEAVLSSVENRSKNTTAGEDGFRPAVEGENPPFNVPTLGRAFQRAMAKSNEGNRKDGRSSPSMKTMAQKVVAMKRLERAAMMHKQASVANFGGKKTNHHRRARTLLDTIGNVEEEKKDGDDNDAAFVFGGEDHFRGFDDIFNEDPSSRSGEDNDEEFNVESETAFAEEPGNEGQVSAHESLPLLAGEGSSDHLPSVSERQWRAKQLLMKKKWKKLSECLNPLRILKNFFVWFIRSSLMYAIPMFVTAWILFYYCGNPSPPEFFPGSATLSWWFNFVGRQLLIFELARLTQFFMIDFLVLSTRFVSRGLGPWVTIFCIQSKGWPFIIGSWGLWALLLLQGNSKFDYHWLYFTGIEIYSVGNSGSYIISSENYLRILLAMVIAGVLTTLKNTLITLYFGKRMFEAYKPRLEEILNDIIMISEVAELSMESHNIANVIGVEKKAKKKEPPHEINTANVSKGSNSRSSSQIEWSTVKFHDDRTGSQPTSMRGDYEEESTDLDSYSDDGGDFSEGKSGDYDASTYRIPIKDLLDKWEEPVNKRDKTFDATVNDILKFRRALTYMDLDFPFSEAFGRASTRNEMILSAETVYNRLMNLSSEPDILSYSVFQILLLQDDGTEDKVKRRSLRNLFRPDGSENLPLLSFVQTCDSVYKKLRYLRASVGNSSVIDQVLESIVNTVFYFVLGLIVLSMLNLNPWPLLVSMSTLLVTASFAVGPSCAKAIEGILLIVGRRPFDIGDRIVITDSPGAKVPAMGMSWFVEDITLFSTTLRFASSNEIATVSNGSIASARVTNCARSKNATVHILLQFHISCHEGNAVEEFRKGVEKFVQDHPNIWDSVLFLRCEEIDPNNEVVLYRLALRSRFTWQICNRVFQSQSEIHKFCVSLSSKLGIKYDSPNTRSIMYYGGSLVDGGVQDYKANVLKNKNINNQNEVLTGLLPKDLVVPVVRGASETTLDAEERLPRIPGTAEESRMREQHAQETNDDELVNLADDHGNDETEGMQSSLSGVNDTDMAFLSNIQKSHDF